MINDIRDQIYNHINNRHPCHICLNDRIVSHGDRIYCHFTNAIHIKIVSTIVVPPKRLPIDKASRVMIVSMEDFITFFHIITLPLTPLAFAPAT